MTTITSLNDLIKKFLNDASKNISNNSDKRFFCLASMFEIHISLIRDSTDVSNIDKFTNEIYGSILTLFYIGYISEIEKDLLIVDLFTIKYRCIEFLCCSIREVTEEGD